MNADEAISAAAMREADRRCIEGLGVPGAVLMYNAGSAVYRACGAGPLAVVCGKGNNGGDGFVAAFLAKAAGREVTTVLLCAPNAVAGDARIYLDAYRRLGGALAVASTPEEAAEAMDRLPRQAVWVDAILGTGAAGAVRGTAAAALAAWPAGVRTVSVDIPSGLDADTGAVRGAAIRAETTVTFQFAKRGLLAPAAAPYVGRLIVADIGIPPACGDDAAWARLTAAE